MRCQIYDENSKHRNQQTKHIDNQTLLRMREQFLAVAEMKGYKSGRERKLWTNVSHTIRPFPIVQAMQQRWPTRNRSCRRKCDTALSPPFWPLSIADTKMSRSRRPTENLVVNESERWMIGRRPNAYLEHEHNDGQRSDPRVQRIEIRNCWRGQYVRLINSPSSDQHQKENGAEQRGVR